MTPIQIKERQHRVKRTVPGLIFWTQSHIQWDEVIKQTEEWVIASEPFYIMFWQSLQMAIFLEISPWL